MRFFSNLKVSIRRRKVPRELSLKRRYGYDQKLTSNDQVRMKKSKSLLLFLMLKSKNSNNPSKYKRLFKLCLMRHLRLLYVEDKPLLPCLPDKQMNIEKFNNEECGQLFIFDKAFQFVVIYIKSCYYRQKIFTSI
jgi:hypothetical protein